MIEIDNLLVTIDGKPILKGFSLKVPSGQIHAIMGPNGAGKSTLAKVLAGHPSYDVEQGDIRINGESMLDLEPEERAAKGLFMSFQYPPEIPGVSNEQFLHYAHSARQKALGLIPLTKEEFSTFLEKKMELLAMREEFLERNVNEGFSGGEKKRNEILQMAVLNPSVAVLDETDSGLDIDALRLVAKGILSLMSPEKSLILITHYQRLLESIRPDKVHVMVDGKITMTGGPELALTLEEKGYG